ncbi:MAG: hypothetical protein PVF68_03685 [Acidobacteriota bacterium]|jgi:hypothetical protein
MNRDHDQDFDEAFRDWGRRPSPTAPEVAATRVVARLESRAGRALRWRFAVVIATTMLLGIPLALWLMPHGGGPLSTTPPTRAAHPAAAMPTPPLDDNVVLSWLDPETPLYFVLSPPDSQ